MSISIRSVVISLSAAEPAPAPQRLHLVAEVARLIGADLRALYVEDEWLFDVADLPLAREFDPLRPSQTRWQPLARQRLARDFELAAAGLRRRLTDAASAAGVKVDFSVVRTDLRRSGNALDALCESGDFAFVMPAGRTARAPLPAGAVLHAPPGLARRSGDVIALARSAESAAVRLAEQIARAARARLIVIDAAGDAEQLHDALGWLQERLIVAAPSAFGAEPDAARLAALRRVPLIVVPDIRRT